MDNGKRVKREPEPIDLLEIFCALKKKALLLFLVALLGGVISGMYTKFFVTPLYSSTSTILVLSKDTTLTSLADLQLGTQLASDYSVLIKSRPVLDQVILDLDLDMSWESLKSSISINNPASTRLLEVTVKHPNPEMAKRIVDEVASVASDYIGEQMEVIPPKIIEEGVLNTSPVSPNVKGNILKGILVGFVLVAGIITVRTIMDDTIKSEEDIEKYLGIPMFAKIPDRKDYISGSRKGRKGRRKNR